MIFMMKDQSSSMIKIYKTFVEELKNIKLNKYEFLNNLLETLLLNIQNME